MSLSHYSNFSDFDLFGIFERIPKFLMIDLCALVAAFCDLLLGNIDAIFPASRIAKIRSKSSQISMLTISGYILRTPLLGRECSHCTRRGNPYGHSKAAPKSLKSFKTLGSVPQRLLRRFSGLFWPLFDLNLGGNIPCRYCPPNLKSKIGSKEPENRQKNLYGTLPKSEIGSS